ncbi:MAG: metallophosphoesterase [Acidobacteria bacterium]|uniref:Metallophosphoesterase n=1 Tax=Candidatus Polarisedimenticola svalbardensis TaxID=2886004 RepID=A0A8J7CC22_9BACT|nr:metallophosphoesterase [Candidatus Polarisedimenticola svalbardensis]
MIGGDVDRQDLVFIGDVHLDRDDPAVEPFCRMLETVAGDAATLVLAGDLFNLWIGGNGPEPDHIRPVLDCLRSIRRSGVAVRYLEGNRDYFIRTHYEGDVFDSVAENGLYEEVAGLRVFSIHGDLANPDDRQYRNWRRFSRSLPVRLLFRACPHRWRTSLADRLESRMRRSNLEYKREFPETAVREYAAGPFRNGCDLVVLGHFHVEKDLPATGPEGSRILVLPEWKGSRRCLRVGADGQARFLPAG